MSDDDPLAAFDTQMRRAYQPSEPGWRAESGDRVTVLHGPAGGHVDAVVAWSDLGADDAERTIAEVQQRLAGKVVEWKRYGHDRPADLGTRLEAAGFVPGEPEHLMVGVAADVAARLAGLPDPDDLRTRRAELATDGPALAALQADVWGGDFSGLVAEIAAEQRADPAALVVWLVEEAGSATVVSCGWLRLHAPTAFASLWGGATRSHWRGRGAYRSLLAVRAGHAAERGFRYLQVDASDASRPILEGLGFTVLDTTVPYLLDGRGGAGPRVL